MTAGAADTGAPATLELLERSLGYTRGALAGVGRTAGSAATPCAGWTLRDLLRHMDDGLAAFVEAAGGAVLPAVTVRGGRHHPDAELRGLVEHLREQGCALLAVWTDEPVDPVAVGAHCLVPDEVAAVGALEIAVHGWDVAQACGLDLPLPPRLAAALLPVARWVVTPEDRPHRFGPARAPVPGGASAATLLTFLGRDVSLTGSGYW